MPPCFKLIIFVQLSGWKTRPNSLEVWDWVWAFSYLGVADGGYSHCTVQTYKSKLQVWTSPGDYQRRVGDLSPSHSSPSTDTVDILELSQDCLWATKNPLRICWDLPTFFFFLIDRKEDSFPSIAQLIKTVNVTGLSCITKLYNSLIRSYCIYVFSVGVVLGRWGNQRFHSIPILFHSSQSISFWGTWGLNQEPHRHHMCWAR